MTEPFWPDNYLREDLSALGDTPEDWSDLYYGEWPEPQTKWVIPHGSSLDYCQVTLGEISPGGTRIRVEGRRTEGWTPDGALIKTSVRLDKLTDVPSWRNDFKDLYDYEYHPNLRADWPTR